jgi:hypothetical protein
MRAGARARTLHIGDGKLTIVWIRNPKTEIRAHVIVSLLTLTYLKWA